MTCQTIFINGKRIYVCGRNDRGQLGNSAHPIVVPSMIDINNNNNSIYDYPIYVSVYRNHSAILTNNGTLLFFGNNDDGQLGLVIDHNIFAPTPCIFNAITESIKYVACGGYHTVISTQYNLVYTFGNNEYGQLGIGNTKNSNQPQLLNISISVRQLSCGEYSTVILDKNGDMRVFGNNRHGQLGLGNNINQYLPEIVGNISGVKSIACGANHTIILTQYHELMATGDNKYGQLGLANNTNNFIFQKIAVTNIPIQISCGQYHSAILLENACVYTFGLNNDGQLGLGHTDSMNSPQLISSRVKFSQVSCGGYHTILLSENNDIFVTGSNCFGQSAANDTHSLIFPTKMNFCATHLMNIAHDAKWTPYKHYSFSDKFKNMVVYFVMLNKFLINGKLKIPKPILYIIIQYCC